METAIEAAVPLAFDSNVLYRLRMRLGLAGLATRSARQRSGQSRAPTGETPARHGMPVDAALLASPTWALARAAGGALLLLPAAYTAHNINCRRPRLH